MQLFTAKERDSETGLDYFGARYYGSNMGRFTSPDPLLNSGHPADPQSWNRYAYTRNNPLKFIDPTGLYDFDQNCKAGDNRCADVIKAVERTRKLADSLPAGDKRKAALDKSLGALGRAGDGNGVVIKFGKTETGGSMDTYGKVITIDTKALSKDLAAYNAANNTSVDINTEMAAGIIHEGTHLTQPTGLLTPQGINIRNKWDILTVFEREAYRSESYVGEVAGERTPLWNPSWAQAGDAEKLREQTVRGAQNSVDLSRKEYENRTDK